MTLDERSPKKAVIGQESDEKRSIMPPIWAILAGLGGIGLLAWLIPKKKRFDEEEDRDVDDLDGPDDEDLEEEAGESEEAPEADEEEDEDEGDDDVDENEPSRERD